MHMADALISPAVGTAMWVASAGLIGYSSKKVKAGRDDRKVPLMGVLGAFIFAAQMVNFSIPATGSSGHLGGGMILAILLGPHAGFLTMASVLTVQALFFADGGLLALGCNIFNLGFFPCFVAYPLLYKIIVGSSHDRGRIIAGALTAAVVGLQLGAFCVVLQTFLSGVSELELGTFALILQPIHLAIGVVEGLATAAVVVFISKARPEILDSAAGTGNVIKVSVKGVAVVFLAAAVVTGTALSWFASTQPDGLEWSIFKTAGTQAIESMDSDVHASLAELQDKTALLPDYNFSSRDPETDHEATQTWPSAHSGTSLSGLVGGALSLMVAVFIGVALKRRKKNT